MSDITKKIFSIEQTGDDVAQSEPSTSDVVRPLAGLDRHPVNSPAAEAVPDFVTRDAKQPLAKPPSLSPTFENAPKSFGWLIAGFGVLYFIAAGLYFGLPLVIEPVRFVTIAGLILLLLLPLILLFLLWRALSHLGRVTNQSAKLSEAAERLVSPETEALARTETLASGIRAQINKLNSGLSNTVEALEGVKIAVTRESQALDAAGLALSSRSEGVSRTLSEQRQSLAAMTDSFDSRMATLSGQIASSGVALDTVCTAAETKLVRAGETLEKSATRVDEVVKLSAAKLESDISELGTLNEKLSEAAEILSKQLTDTTQGLGVTDSTLAEQSISLGRLNAETQAQLTELQGTIVHGHELLVELQSSAETRSTEIAAYYTNLASQMKKSEDETLALQSETTKTVESNLAQMRRDFGRMETDLQALQAKINNLRDVSDTIPAPEEKPNRLTLMPLDSDFPPVQPPEIVQSPPNEVIGEEPLNLGMDMEIASDDAPLINFKPDVIRRPGEVKPQTKTKGFGRRSDRDDKSGWRWRDMLGTLERPDNEADIDIPPIAIDASPTRNIDGAALLTAIQLSPEAIVDEGTVIDATQARINGGETGMTSIVVDKLPEAVAHLKDSLVQDAALQSDLRSFTRDFSKIIGNTPPTAPALRAAFGSAEGRAYLLCAAALKPELRE